jgi:hypothetical protein
MTLMEYILSTTTTTAPIVLPLDRPCSIVMVVSTIRSHHTVTSMGDSCQHRHLIPLLLSITRRWFDGIHTILETTTTIIVPVVVATAVKHSVQQGVATWGVRRHQCQSDFQLWPLICLNPSILLLLLPLQRPVVVHPHHRH